MKERVIMKFKVGDKVRVVDAVTPAKKKYIGRVSTITEVSRELVYPYGVLGINWLWCDNELESVDTEFTKSDLQCGMVVEYRGGGRRMVLGDRLIGLQSEMQLSYFNDTLEQINSSYTIDKVYKSNAHRLDSYFNDYNLELIWERPIKKKKMTIAEIEKELGYKIEIVDDKEK
jgi:hypothetical protein